MKFSLLLVLALIVSACGSRPKNPEEFKKFASESSFAYNEHFAVNGTLKDAEARFNEYSERCLSKAKTMQKCGSFSCNKAYVSQTFIPNIEREKSLVRLTLKREDANLSTDGSTAFYIMVAEVESDKGGLKGHVYAPKIGYGDLTGSTKGWATGENKTCPSF